MSVNFNDWNLLTRDTKFTADNELLTEATKESYLFDLIFEGTDISKSFKGGRKLTEFIQGEDGGTFGFYNPNQELNLTQKDTLVQAEWNWTYAKSSWNAVEEILGLNDGDVDAFIKLRKSYELQCATDTVNGMEEQLFASPDFDLMESATVANQEARQATSILAYVTRDGEVPAAGNGGIASGSSAWTSISQINVTNNAWYKNVFKTYTAGSIVDPEVGLIRALDGAVRKSSFMMPTVLRKWSDPENTRQRKHVIITSEDGANIYDTVIRANNDRMAMFNDPGVSGPQFKGVPVMYIAELDNAGWTDGSPDYLGLNFNFLRPFFRSGHFMRSKIVPAGARQPNTDVNFKFTHYNLACTSRRRQFRISAA